jgi:hypothetical protein
MANGFNQIKMTTEDEMLEELRKIRQLMEPKPSPPPSAPKGLWEEFVDFIGKVGVHHDHMPVLTIDTKAAAMPKATIANGNMVR